MSGVEEWNELMSDLPRLAFTIGDPAGIGMEGNRLI